MIISRRLLRAAVAVAMLASTVAAACASGSENVEFDETPRDPAEGPSAGGSSGAGGASGGTRAGTCNPAFCPNGNIGAPCCMAADGPCGVMQGGSCVAPPSADF